MKRLWIISLAVLLVAAVCAPAFAWEFSLKGQHEYRLRYWERTGANDLFGFAPTQEIGGLLAFSGNAAGFVGAGGPGWNNRNFVGFAGPTSYNTGAIPAVPTVGALNALGDPYAIPNNVALGQSGYRITRGGFSSYGSTAIYPDSRLTLEPTFKVNEAIRVHGVYNIGGYRNRYGMFGLGNQGGFAGGGVGLPPYERYMGQNAQSFSSQDTIGIGSWEQVRATVQLPMFTMSYGLKDFPYGLGLFTTYRLRGSAFVVVVPYGPFRFIPAFWEGYSTNFGVETYDFHPDGNNKAMWFGGFLFTYEAGDLSTGGGFITRQHHNPSSEVNWPIVSFDSNKFGTATVLGMGGGANTFPLDGFPYPTTGLGPGSYTNRGFDENLFIGSWYLKYFNGRFFTNMAYEWSTISRNYIQPVAAGQAVPDPWVNNGRYTVGLFNERYHLMWEAGALCGPAKVTLVWAQSSGPVMNNGNQFQVAAQAASLGINGGVNPKLYTGWAIDWQLLDPYNYLMFGVYGGGNQAFGSLFLCDDGHGMLADGYMLGGRVDYAVACNLNVWGSYIYARRLEKYGTLLGAYNSDGSMANGASRFAFYQNIGYTPPAEGLFVGYVPDDYLGWEMNLGFDWKLLEGLTYRARYAYWQPGDWFNYAYQAVMPFGHNGSPTANGYLGTRSAIQAFEGSLVIDF